ncbi:hypothetical protein ACQJBY_063630 [Aegilops geniculata]
MRDADRESIYRIKLLGAGPFNRLARDAGDNGGRCSRLAGTGRGLVAKIVDRGRMEVVAAVCGPRCDDDGPTGVLVMGSRARVLVVALSVVEQSSVARPRGGSPSTHSSSMAAASWTTSPFVVMGARCDELLLASWR